MRCRKLLTFKNWHDPTISSIIKSHPDFLDIIQWAYAEYGEKVVYASSFGVEAIVLIDLIYKVHKKAKIIFLDTGLHFKETYEFIEEVKKRYPSLEISMIQPKVSLEEQAKWYGEELWKHNPNLCCQMRKVAPLEEALENVEAWITGVRREQSPLRKDIQYINKDEKFKKIKICPLIHWTWDDIQSYIEINQLPYHPLFEKGYLSIGCAPCTLPVDEKGHLRAGRWSGTTKTECGLHQTT